MSNGNGNGGETDTENDDGEGDKGGGGGGVLDFLLKIAATAAASAIISFGNKLFGDRSVFVTVTNNTPKPLRKTELSSHA
jgi:hypothetical protein